MENGTTKIEIPIGTDVQSTSVEPIGIDVKPVELVEPVEPVEPVKPVESKAKKNRKSRRKKKEINAQRLASKMNDEIESNMVIVPKETEPSTTSKIDGSKTEKPAIKKEPLDKLKLVGIALLGVGILAISMYLFRNSDKRVDVVIVGQSESHSEDDSTIFS